MTKTLPSKEDWIRLYPWLNPYTQEYPDDKVLKPNIVKPKKPKTILFACASHKSIACYQAIRAKHLEDVYCLEWELMNVRSEGEIDGTYYYWGMPVLGMGLMNLMVPAEYSRELLPEEREYWANTKLTMVGSHTGKVSQTGLSTGVIRD